MRNPENNLVKVYTAHGRIEASIVKSKLESEDISVILKSGAEIFGITVDGLGAIEVLVLKHEIERAKKILFDQR